MRLFTGIAIDPRVLDKISRVLAELRPLAKLNWSPVENLHITTKFIGAWPEERLEDMKSALAGVQFSRAFDITIANFGYFPNPHHPHSFFAGVHAGPELPELAGRIDDALVPLGIAKEKRPYNPHLTLARIKKQDVRALRGHIAKMTDFDFGKFTASAFHLYLSKPGPAGSVYTSLADYPLRATAGLPAGLPL
jgi:RNA 2',3'-cyclic 3'-phosphodiesterase